MNQAQFAIFGIPVRVEPNALFLAAFIGFQIGTDAIYLIAVFFFSILLHELGHALMFRRYGCQSFISIHGMGGTTSSFNAQRLNSKQHIFVSLAGPLSQLLLLGIPSIVWRSIHGPYGYTGWILDNMIYINVGWAVLNLVPIYPLDGGQVLLEVLKIKNADDPMRIVRAVSIGVGVPVAIAAYFYVGPFAAIIIGYVVFRGAMSGQGQASNGIQAAANQARADHRRDNVKGPDRAAALNEAYVCLLDGNLRRMATLVDHLNAGRGRNKSAEDLVTLRAWDAVLFGQSSRMPGLEDAQQGEAAPASSSSLLHAAVSAIAGKSVNESRVGAELIAGVESPEILPAIALLSKYDKLEASLGPVSEDGLDKIVDALVKGGLPHEQMAVSRVLRLRQEAASEGS